MHVDAPHDRIPDGCEGPGGTVPGPTGPHEAGAPTVSAQELLTRALGLLRGPGSATGRTVLGLAGPPAAGKSAVARHLVDGIVASEGPGAAAYLPLDGFHLSNTQLDRLGLRARKGAPATFDTAGYLALLGRVVTSGSTTSTRRISTGHSTSPSRRGTSLLRTRDWS
ncbi:hypothetical protein KNE206_75270 [Kitasatospora sp. NE20-6]|uniref:hypothetical protein n=1 Tax=Kitasatospora sp. NE20-6 TaxID=2859066 RepID=UPI0034DC6F13